MTIDTRLPLEPLVDSVRHADAHGEARASLLLRANGILSGRQTASSPERSSLAAKLERWRYQHLNERAGRLRAEDFHLVDALDLAANELAGRPARPPRRARGAVADSSPGPAVEEAAACLDDSVPLEAIADRASRMTAECFGPLAAEAGSSPAGRRMLMYAPLYLSSFCINHCTYCGFRYSENIARKHLTQEEALAEAAILMERGFRHILLVGGDFPSLTTAEYYAGVAAALARRGVAPAIEIAPQPTADYARLVEAGISGLSLYQETYDEAVYARVHPKGSKVSYDWRLEGMDRAAEAGVPRLGFGVLLGLADPRRDLLAMIRHARYIQSRFPHRTLAFSLPRIREAPGDFRVPYHVDDSLFVRMYCALRIAFPRAELVLSTREAIPLRSRLARICVTQMSAGSRTTPGGYENPQSAGGLGEQFPVTDHRSPAEVAAWLAREGFDVRWEISPG